MKRTIVLLTIVCLISTAGCAIAGPKKAAAKQPGPTLEQQFLQTLQELKTIKRAELSRAAQTYNALRQQLSEIEDKINDLSKNGKKAKK